MSAHDVDWPTVGPRLLEALERLCVHGEGVVACVHGGATNIYTIGLGGLEGLLTAARSAIAAAKGETT